MPLGVSILFSSQDMKKMDTGGYQAGTLEFSIDILKHSEAILKIHRQRW